MKTKGTIFAVVVLILLSHASCGAEDRNVVRREGSLNALAATASDAGDIQKLINSLSEDDQDVRLKAQSELLRLAGESPADREAVIHHLIRSLEGLNFEGKLVLDTRSFRLWSSATRLFSSLQATESIDLLIRFIYCGDGLSGAGPNHHPAEDALLSMGNLALPKLTEALLNNENPVIRKSVAKCLGNIGGPESKQTLERALQSESDQNVIHTINLALAAIAREPSRL